MATSIAFTDGTGAASLVNGKPAPGDRFRSWEPYTVVVGPREVALATGLPYTYRHRTDYCVRFSLPYIPRTSMATLMRLHRWLAGGGSCTVNTGDAASRNYTAVLAPDADIEAPELTESAHIEYTAVFNLMNTAQADMLCEYS